MIFALVKYLFCFPGEAKPTKDAESKELTRPRLDTGKDIFTQLTAVFDETPANAKSKLDIPVETVNTDGDTTIIHISDPVDEVLRIL